MLLALQQGMQGPNGLEFELSCSSCCRDYYWAYAGQYQGSAEGNAPYVKGTDYNEIAACIRRIT